METNAQAVPLAELGEKTQALAFALFQHKSYATTKAHRTFNHSGTEYAASYANCTRFGCWLWNYQGIPVLWLGLSSGGIGILRFDCPTSPAWRFWKVKLVRNLS
jgi:hypothetical protein